MAITLKAFFETYNPNVIVINGHAYGLNPEDVTAQPGPQGNVTIRVPHLNLTLKAPANQSVDPDGEYTITIVDTNGNTYVFEGRPKNVAMGPGGTQQA